MSLRLLWAKMQLIAGARPAPGGERPRAFRARRLAYPELSAVERARGPERPAYDALATYYHAYASPRQPDYVAYLAGLSAAAGQPLRSVLDLACGAGTTTERLAHVVPAVVGLDASEPMLAEARRRCAALPGVRFLAGDFRHFGLGQTFDAVVCAANSLNYVRAVDELAAVFRCVAAHLRPGGWFVFDTTTDRGMRNVSGSYTHYDVGGRRFAIRFRYKHNSRREKSTVLFPDGIEIHWRIALDPADVARACAGTGLAVADAFSVPGISARRFTGGRAFFMLVRGEATPPGPPG